MPTILPIPIQVNRPDRLPADARRALHANFFTWLSAGDPAVAQAVHETFATKPFALSTLSEQGGEFVFRVSLLDDELWDPFWAGMLEVGHVNLLGQRLPIQEGWLTREFRPYAVLAAEAQAATEFRFRFLTPTSFRTGKLHYPLPEPRSIFRSLLVRWNAFAPPELWMDEEKILALVEEHLGISRHAIRTEIIDFGKENKGKQIGFVGRVTLRFRAPHLVLEEDLRRLNALADYAHFCGIGHKTTHGMGQTRREPGRKQNRNHGSQ